MGTLQHRFVQKTVQDFVHLFVNDQLNLQPGFQRESVWNLSDRKKLLESIFQRYPVPSIFLWKRSENGKLIYDVLDGKQRLESILMYQRLRWFRSDGFSVRAQVDDTEQTEEWDWGRLQRKGCADRLMGYEFQIVEIAGDDLSDIISLFVRINSTGKRLTGAEQRHAKYFRTPFLKQAEKLARRHEAFFIGNRILSPGQVSRMKHMELTCELLASIHVNGLIDKKRALDDIIGGQAIDGRSVQRCIKEFVRTVNRLKKMFPRLRETRFANSADFYTLFLIVRDLDREGCILTERGRNEQAQRLLIWLSNGVDAVRDRIRNAQGAKPDERLFADYLMTVRADADSRATRARRAEIIRSLFGSLFSKKDKQRGFTSEQRRLIWHTDEKKKCPDCGDVLSWENFTIDHIKAHSRGGPSTISNSRLMCLGCNAKRGAGRR